ncbi:MAG: hypothetical protein HC915_04795 [Anaerolineae bacterium]|nr:hypothetical protein [Anaerolineae bacterium]
MQARLIDRTPRWLWGLVPLSLALLLLGATLVLAQARAEAMPYSTRRMPSTRPWT